MAAISLIDPYSQQAEEIARRQRMAQALQESGSQVLQMPTTPGVAISPLAGLAKIFESGLGAYQEKKAREDYAKLQNDYRTNYNNQLGEMARLISAPEVKGVAGQEATKDIPGWTRPLGLDTSVNGGTEMFENVAPVQGKPAIAPVEARPAGYISPEDLQKFDIPEVKQLLMSKYLAQFEPKDVKLGAGDVLYRQLGANGQLTPVATAAPTPQRPIALSPGQELRGPTGNLLATAATKEGKTVTPVWKEVVRDGKIYYEDFNNPDAAARQAGAIEKEAVKTAPHYSEVEKDGNVVIIDMNLPADQRLANAQVKAPIRNNLEKITTTDESGREVSRYVDKGLLATMGDIPAPYKGFMSDLAEAGQLPKNWQSVPQIAGLVRENLINKAGGITPKDLASLKVRIAEAASRLAYEGVPGFNPAGLTPPLSDFTTLSGGAPAAAATPEQKITTRAEIAEAAKRANKSIEQVTRDAVAKGYKVQ